MSNNKTSFRDYCLNNGVSQMQQDTLVIKKKPKTNVAQAISDVEAEDFNYVLLDNFESHSEYCNDGQKQVIKSLKQGKYLTIATLDLHNYKQNEAMLRLQNFINNITTPGSSCIKVIHGKGLNSRENKAVLKILVRRFLEHHKRLLAYTKASENDGGDGATLIKLKN